MRIHNLLYLDSWNAYADDLGSSFKLNKNKSVLSVEMDKTEKKKEAYPWVALVFEMDVRSEKMSLFDLSGCKTITISYKAPGEHDVFLYLKEMNVLDSSMMNYFRLPASDEWVTVKLNTRNILPPHSEKNKIPDYKSITGLIFGFDFSLSHCRSILHIKECIMDDHFIITYENFNNKIYKKGITAEFKYIYKRMEEIFFKMVENIYDFLKMNSGKTIRNILWNNEYKKGKWDYLLTGDNLNTINLIKKYLNKGRILDLGCGFGTLVDMLGENNYKEYTGVDISQNAIKKAIENHYSCLKCRFISQDIFSYVPDKKYDLVLFHEVIYYFDYIEIRKLINKYSMYLNDKGLLCFSIDNKKDFSHVVEFLINNYNATGIHHLDDMPGQDAFDENAIVIFINSKSA